jgi:rod shape-determining protein MreB
VLSKFKTQIFYVQIRENSFTVRCANSGKSVSLDADMPFSSKHLLVGEFDAAETLLKQAFKYLQESWLRPIAIMHPIELIGEKLSDVEEKVLQELALSAGARDVKLWIGEELTDQEILNA